MKDKNYGAAHHSPERERGVQPIPSPPPLHHPIIFAPTLFPSVGAPTFFTGDACLANKSIFFCTFDSPHEGSTTKSSTIAA